MCIAQPAVFVCGSICYHLLVGSPLQFVTPRTAGTPVSVCHPTGHSAGGHLDVNVAMYKLHRFFHPSCFPIRWLITNCGFCVCVNNFKYSIWLNITTYFLITQLHILLIPFCFSFSIIFKLNVCLNQQLKTQYFKAPIVNINLIFFSSEFLLRLSLFYIFL